MGTPKRIAIASCSNLPGWEIDDKPLLDQLETCCDVAVKAWDDPSVGWSNYDAVLIRTTWDYQEKLGKFLDWVDHVSGVTRLFNDARWIRWNTQKTYLRALEREGCAIAPTQWLPRGERHNLAKLTQASSGPLRWFLKPVVGACASNTLRFDQADMASAQGFLDGLADVHSFMLQPYLESVETEGEYSLLYIDGELTHAVRKVPVPGDYRVQDDFGASDMAIEPDERLRAVGRAVLAACQRATQFEAPLLYARLDFLQDEAGVWLLNEAELIEPSLFLRHAPRVPNLLADALLRRLD